MKKFLLLALLFFTAVQGGERRLVRIHIDRPDQVQDLLQRQLDLASRRVWPYADAVLSAAEESQLRQAGFRLEVLMPPAALAKTTTALAGDMGAFHTYQELSDELAALAESYSDIMQVTSIGKTVEGRDIWAVKISDNVRTEETDEAEVLYTACIHAREIITPEILLDFIQYLLSLYGHDDTTTQIVNERQLWLVPMQNPDGHVRVENGDIWWRKNCRLNSDGSEGVDLNRNYGYRWGFDSNGSSSRPSSETYRGTAPFSEPETAALRDLASQHDFVAVLNYHSYSDLVIFPWGFIPEDTPHHEIYLALSRQLVRSSGYEYGNARMGILYGTNGDADDFFYGSSLDEGLTFSFTIEVGDRFHPEEAEISGLIAENRPANIYLALIADQLAKDPRAVLDSTRATVPDGIQQASAPEEFSLTQNFPNPFNAVTTVAFALPAAGEVFLTLHDATGRLVRTLAAGTRPAGKGTIRFDAAGLASGLYFCHLTAPGGQRTIRMLLLR